jgi:YbbR domain-containing protein
VTIGRAFRRSVRFVVHNWPLKLAAIALATLLYAGLVASQDSSTFPGPVTVIAQNQPPDTVITNQLRDVESIRYLAPAGAQRPRAGDFRATIDLTNVKPDGNPVNVPVRVTPVDPDITVLEVTPRTVQVVLDTSSSKIVPVRVERGPAPEGTDVGETVYEPGQVMITGATSAVERVVAVLVTVTLDPNGLDVDREIEARPIDTNGEVVTGVDVDPRTVLVQIPLYTNKESRTLPVNPIITGAPAPGFRIAAIEVDPLVVTVEGDADQLTALTQVDTAPVAIFGSTSDVEQRVVLTLPSGIVATGSGTVTVAVRIEPVTETRTYSAGIRLDGADPDLQYDLQDESVLLTLFGSVADLDQLGSAPLVVGVNVAGLDPGPHEVSVVPVIPSGVTVAAIDPATVTVVVAGPEPATASAAPATVPPPAPATPSPSPSGPEPSTTP